MEPFSSFMGFYRVISWLSPIESSTELRSILSTDSWNRSFLFQKDFTRISNGTSALSESTSAVFFFAMALRNQSRFEILSGSRSNGTRIRGEVVSFIWFFFLETETRTDSTGGQRSRKRRPLAAVRVRRPFRPTSRQLPRRRRRRRRTTTPPQPHAATLQLFRFL